MLHCPPRKRQELFRRSTSNLNRSPVRFLRNLKRLLHRIVWYPQLMLVAVPSTIQTKSFFFLFFKSINGSFLTSVLKHTLKAISVPTTQRHSTNAVRTPCISSLLRCFLIPCYHDTFVILQFWPLQRSFLSRSIGHKFTTIIVKWKYVLHLLLSPLLSQTQFFPTPL